MVIRPRPITFNDINIYIFRLVCSVLLFVRKKKYNNNNNIQSSVSERLFFFLFTQIHTVIRVHTFALSCVQIVYIYTHTHKYTIYLYLELYFAVSRPVVQLLMSLANVRAMCCYYCYSATLPSTSLMWFFVQNNL